MIKKDIIRGFYSTDVLIDKIDILQNKTNNMIVYLPNQLKKIIAIARNAECSLPEEIKGIITKMDRGFF